MDFTSGFLRQSADSALVTDALATCLQEHGFGDIKPPTTIIGDEIAPKVMALEDARALCVQRDDKFSASDYELVNMAMDSDTQNTVIFVSPRRDTSGTADKAELRYTAIHWSVDEILTYAYLRNTEARTVPPVRGAQRCPKLNVSSAVCKWLFAKPGDCISSILVSATTTRSCQTRIVCEPSL